jgi:hypothetical protein
MAEVVEDVYPAVFAAFGAVEEVAVGMVMVDG